MKWIWIVVTAIWGVIELSAWLEKSPAEERWFCRNCRTWNAGAAGTCRMCREARIGPGEAGNRLDPVKTSPGQRPENSANASQTQRPQ